MISKQVKPSKKSKFDSTAATASSASGFTLLLNFIIPSAFEIPPEQAQEFMTITPIIGGFIAWVISIAFSAFGKDPQLIHNERAINKKIKQLKQDLEDPLLADKEKEKLNVEYAKLVKLRRHPELLSSAFNHKESA